MLDERGGVEGVSTESSSELLGFRSIDGTTTLCEESERVVWLGMRNWKLKIESPVAAELLLPRLPRSLSDGGVGGPAVTQDVDEEWLLCRVGVVGLIVSIKELNLS